MAEVKKECGQFDRDIGKALRDKKSVTMNAEKVIRYIEDKVKTKVKENFRLQVYSDKNSDLKSQ